jgi:hypothetical protein
MKKKKGIGDAKKLARLRREHPLPKIQYVGSRLPIRKGFFFDKRVQKWVIPFLGSDASVVKRTQVTNTVEYDKDSVPFQYAAYFGFHTFFWMAVAMLVGLVFFVLAKFNFGRKMLLKVCFLHFFFFCTE